MNAYSDLRSRRTPIPTPPLVRTGTSLLIGLGVAVPSTGLARGVQVGVMVLAIAVGLLLMFGHPYRREIKQFLEEKNAVVRPRLGQVLPLFFVWLALMVVPVFAPLPAWGTALVWLAVSAWMFWVFPHIDGTRALAYA
jgi:fatty acid desaturase